MVNAEEMGVTAANAGDMMSSSTDPGVRRLLGVEGDFGKNIGLENNWAANAIKAVGNYGEIYERHIGANGLNIPRGPNNLWTEGGLIYAPPMR